MTKEEIESQILELKEECNQILDKCKEDTRTLTDEEKEEIEEIKSKISSLRELEEEEEPIEETPVEEEPKEEKESSEEEEEEKVEEKSFNKKNNKGKIMEFSLLGAIREVANNRSLSEAANAVVNAGAEEMRNAGLSFQGQIQLPVESRAALTVASEVNSDGYNDVVAVDMYDILAPLRAKNVLVQAGAKFMTGLVGDVQVPVMGAGNVAWEGEVIEAPEFGTAYTSVRLQPKRLTAYIDISKQFLNQTGAAAEALIRQDMINAINSKLEETILGTAAGTATQPAGIFYSATTLPTVGSYAALADLEADVEDANVIGECAYIMSNKAKAAYRTMAKADTVAAGFVLENGNIDGTPVYNTSSVANKNVAYGDFSNLAIGQWGSIDLTVDPFTVAKDGKVRLVINTFFDAKVLREGAIAVGKVE